jgi:hypothetical protein
MAKLYGTLVGTPLQNLAATGFGGVSNRYKDGMDQVLVRDYLNLGGAQVGDTISLAQLKSTALIDQGNSFIWFGGAGASVTLNIGDVNHPATFANALSLAAAGVSPIQALWQPFWMGYPLWQRLGYAADPGGVIELLGTIGGAAPLGAPVAWQIFGRNT